MLSSLKSRLAKLPVLRGIAARRRFARRFANELRLFAGEFQPAPGAAQSALFFTLHKCASIYAAEVVASLARDAGLAPIDFEAYFWVGGKADCYPLKAEGRGGHLYKKTGLFYGPFRVYHDGVPNLDDFKIILMLRDPRDMLVSHYFSVAYSHGVPHGNAAEKEYLLARRAEALAKPIDDYVLELAPIFAERYETYARELLGRPNVLYLKYEEMIGDFDAWLKRILDFTGWPPREETLARLRASARRGENPSEDVSQHRRQALPGDHKRKLKPETAERLADIFAPSLEPLGYQP